MEAKVGRIRRLSNSEIEALDPYAFMAVVGKRLIHPGGRKATDELLSMAAIDQSDRVLDVGCGVGTTAIRVARESGASVEAVDIAPLMLERARANVERAGVADRVRVQQGNILDLRYDADSFDKVIAEAVTMFVDRPRAASELARVCRPGGKVLATEFLWRRPPTSEARHTFLGEVCPGLTFDSLEEWVDIYRTAGLADIHTATGPFDMMTPTGFIKDEGLLGTGRVMGQVLSRWSHVKKMRWLWPRVNRAVPYLGYVVVSGAKPHDG